jgi:group I intron endonuclease
VKTYVYQLTNTINGKVYYGKTPHLLKRWYDHCKAAEYGSSFPIHRAIRKYGPEAFKADILGEHDTNEGACEHEIRLIAEAKGPNCYNIADGGDGGLTMSSEQLEAQYGIKPSQHEDFKRLFEQGMPAVDIARHFGVGRSSAARCANKLGLSFQDRRLPHGPKPSSKPVRKYTSRATMTLDERSAFRSEVAKRANKARGASPEVQAEALRLYFEEHLTAKEVAERLGTSRGVVRGAVNRAYATMSPQERAVLKHQHGSAVRSGRRNPNARIGETVASSR